MSKPDFLDEMVAERTAGNPGFPKLLEQAQARRELLATLAEQRGALDLSQTTVAAAMGTSQSFVAKLENTAVDTKLSTVEKFASAVGLKVQFRLVPEDSEEPLVIGPEGVTEKAVAEKRVAASR
jgi:transcriptional regulator with XRE-family HTH domain